MLRKDPTFTALKVGGASLGGRTSYWLGSDHLLAVSVSYFTETYRRLYYADMAVISVRKTQARAWVLGSSGVLAGLLALWLSFVIGPLLQGGRMNEDTWLALVFLGTPMLVCVVLAIVELVSGPSCEVRVQTAVQAVTLPGVRRWAKAQRLVAALRPRIAAAQPGLPGQAPVELAAASPAAADAAGTSVEGGTGVAESGPEPKPGA